MAGLAALALRDADFANVTVRLSLVVACSRLNAPELDWLLAGADRIQRCGPEPLVGCIDFLLATTCPGLTRSCHGPHNPRPEASSAYQLESG
jgi:hypothetical protein